MLTTGMAYSFFMSAETKTFIPIGNIRRTSRQAHHVPGRSPS